MRYRKILDSLFISQVMFILITQSVASIEPLQGSGMHRSEGLTARREEWIFDFENDHNEGWAHSTKSTEQAITGVYATSEEAYQGDYSLAMDIHLDYSSPDLARGVASVMFPGDMRGSTISVWVNCPDGAQGDRHHPNGIQLFVKDQAFKAQFTDWQHIGEHISEEEWVEFRLTLPEEVENDVDASRAMIVGIQLTAGDKSQVPFKGICYVDFMNVSREALIVPTSNHLFDFDQLTAQQQEEKPFGYGPFWDIDSDWNASAWESQNITVQDGALAISATFSVTASHESDQGSKGFVGVDLSPNLDLSNKENRVVRMEVRFDPYVEPETMQATLFLYDKRDTGECKREQCKWYQSRGMRVGGAIWNEVLFDLHDASHFENETCIRPCIQPSEISSDSLKNISKVGLQLYANQAYSGTIYLDNVTIGGEEILHVADLNQGFMTRTGGELTLNDEPYRFAGSNTYYLFYKSHYMIDDMMATMQRNGLPVLRTWGFGDGKAPHAEENDNGIANGNEGNAFQPEMGLYYEPTFVNFDYVVKSAGEHGIRLIIPLVNYWSDNDNRITGTNSFGGVGQYLAWCAELDRELELEYEDKEGKLINKDLFYDNECSKEAYKAYVEHMLTRVNRLTGVAYKDDPTILAWELINEPRCENRERCQNGDKFYQWADEMSAYIKELDPNHLVAVGDEGMLNQPRHSDEHDDYYNGSFGIDWERNLSIDSIDFGTVHLYPDHWQKDLAWSEEWIKEHIRIAQQVGKPVVFEEFAICYDEQQIHCENTFDRNAAYTAWTNLFERNGTSNLVWMLAGQVNSPIEEHIEINGDYYHPNYDGFAFWEPNDTMQLIQHHAAQMAIPRRNIYLPVMTGEHRRQTATHQPTNPATH